MNVMLIIYVIVIILGIYLFMLSLRMKKSGKVERFIIAEEAMRFCKDEAAFAEYLSVRTLVFSIILIICGALMALNESIFDMGKWIYIVYAILAVGVVFFYNYLTDGKNKFC